MLMMSLAQEMDYVREQVCPPRLQQKFSKLENTFQQALKSIKVKTELGQKLLKITTKTTDRYEIKMAVKVLEARGMVEQTINTNDKLKTAVKEFAYDLNQEFLRVTDYMEQLASSELKGQALQLKAVIEPNLTSQGALPNSLVNLSMVKSHDDPELLPGMDKLGQKISNDQLFAQKWEMAFKALGTKRQQEHKLFYKNCKQKTANLVGYEFIQTAKKEPEITDKLANNQGNLQPTNKQPNF